MAVAEKVKKVAQVEHPPPPPASLFARRLARLEQVSIEIRRAQRDVTNSLVAEKRQKASIYQSSQAKSHGEREGWSAAGTVDLVAETLEAKGRLAELEEERDFLKFCIEYDVGE